MKPPFDLYLITDRRMAPGGDLPALLAKALAPRLAAARGPAAGGPPAGEPPTPAPMAPQGTLGVQLREKDLGAGDLLALAREIREITRPAGVPLLINDRLDVAMAAKADGVHLAGHSLPVAEARSLLGPDRYLAVSAHSLEEAASAASGGADFATFSPVYRTPSKAAYGPPVGLQKLQRACAALNPFPLVALGGITPENAAACLEAGAAGVSVIRAVWTAADPANACAALLQERTSTWDQARKA